MKTKNSGPKKGAAKRWSEKLKKLREQPPTTDLIERLNQTKNPKKVATSRAQNKDLEV